jgi:hypothetical protein
MNGLLLLGALIPFAVVRLSVREIRLARRLHKVGIEVIGRVVREREERNRSGVRFIPTVSFTTQLGQTIVGESASAGKASNLEFFDGDEVVLYYDPDQPARFLFAQELVVTSRYYLLAFAVLLLLVLLSAGFLSSSRIAAASELHRAVGCVT